MHSAIRGLTLLGTIAGALVILYGLALFLAAGSLPGLFIALAVIIVGPVEDWLQHVGRHRAKTGEAGEAWAMVVDRATSLAFLLLLIATLYTA